MQTQDCMALSDYQVRKVWDGLLGAEIRGHYFAELVGTCKLRQKIFTWALLLCSSGACFAVISHWNTDWPKIALTLTTTALSLFLLLQRYEDRATRCSDLHFEWGRIANDYEAVWQNVYADDAAGKLISLADRERSLSKISLDIRDNDKLLLKCQEYVERHHGAK